MRAIRFRLTPELLIQALQLPVGTTPLGLGESPDFLIDHSYIMIVSNEDFPEVPEGSQIPEVTPEISVSYVIGKEKIEFWDWRLDNEDIPG